MSLSSTVTFCLISYNDEKIIGDCLKSIRSQDYDQSLVDILIVDGGSTDRTLEIAAAYNANVISRPDLCNFPSVRGGIAYTTPKTDFLVFFSADNRLDQQDILSLMVASFVDPTVFGCEPLLYGSSKSDPIISRYFSLIGGADPIAVSLGKADRAAHDTKGWHLHVPFEDHMNHYIGIFSDDISKIPTIGANGFMMKRSLLKHTTVSENAAHIDMCVELIKAGYNKCAFIKERSINHYINVGLAKFVMRRLMFANQYSSDKIRRVYSVYQSRDFIKLAFIVFSSVSVIYPLLRSIKGYYFKRDIAWFLHPIVINVFVFSYALHFTKKFFYEKIRSA